MSLYFFELILLCLGEPWLCQQFLPPEQEVSSKVRGPGSFQAEEVAGQDLVDPPAADCSRMVLDDDVSSSSRWSSAMLAPLAAFELTLADCGQSQ